MSDALLKNSGLVSIDEVPTEAMTGVGDPVVSLSGAKDGLAFYLIARLQNIRYNDCKSDE